MSPGSGGRAADRGEADTAAAGGGSAPPRASGPPLRDLPDVASVAELLAGAARDHPDRTAFLTLPEGGAPGRETWSWGAWAGAARRVAGSNRGGKAQPEPRKLFSSLPLMSALS